MADNFTPIDMKKWSRREVFYYFTKLAPARLSFTVDVDITETRCALKERNIKFFPAYLWIVTKAINADEAFRVAYLKDTLGIYETLAPLFPIFHEDDHTASLMWLPYTSAFSQFCDKYMETMELYGVNHGAMSIRGQITPPNCFGVSSVPWLNYSHFSLTISPDIPNFFPAITSGKYVEKNERLMMPISITAHHATVDGWQISQFFEKVQYNFTYPDTWVCEEL
jgi:chloramphenicol O-acetyltransferase type A